MIGWTTSGQSFDWRSRRPLIGRYLVHVTRVFAEFPRALPIGGGDFPLRKKRHRPERKCVAMRGWLRDTEASASCACLEFFSPLIFSSFFRFFSCFIPPRRFSILLTGIFASERNRILRQGLTLSSLVVAGGICVFGLHSGKRYFVNKCESYFLWIYVLPTCSAVIWINLLMVCGERPCGFSQIPDRLHGIWLIYVGFFVRVLVD